MRRLGVLTAAGVVAAFGGLAALDASATGAPHARSPVPVLWVGSITVSYKFERRDPNPATTQTREWQLRIVIGSDGRAISRAHFQDGWSIQTPQCPAATTTHAGVYSGTTRRPHVEFEGRRYRVVYYWPVIPTTITAKNCQIVRTTKGSKSLTVRIPLGGTSPPNADVIGGKLTQTVLRCPDAPRSTCSETKKATWYLRRATLPGAGAGAGCNARRRSGTNRADQLVGTVRNERLRGRAGNDLLRGYGGRDCLDGGAGADRLLGARGGDVIDGGAGKDVIDAGAGDDVVHGRDRDRDRIECGPGSDVVYADRVDRLRGCEVVRS